MKRCQVWLMYLSDFEREIYCSTSLQLHLPRLQCQTVASYLLRDSLDQLQTAHRPTPPCAWFCGAGAAAAKVASINSRYRFHHLDNKKIKPGFHCRATL
ncbi:hypothetical protein AV530_018515 [Patagioenas fasciata monilis]|uniref:Uncharacterized protein n=1 Tax=Patagioenas fasciata monilis TaxID=372326 RepID=A0A1V4JSB8_PATFA|nr:hypothetical protein AV530_018515 [Patagioenas fasciata monilis]